MDGWISLHRLIQDHWLWKDKPFDKRSAWIDLLLMANHKDNKFLLGNEIVEVKRGSFITSELKLMDRWGWSNTKVRSFLNLLEADEMIIKNTDRKKSAISIVNYNDYQIVESAKEVQEKRIKSVKEVKKHTNNNDNKDNNNISIYSIFDSYSENPELRQALRDYSIMRNKIKAPLTERAATMLVNKLDTLASTDDLKIKIVEQAILSNWKSVFPLKEEKQQKPKTNKFHNFIQSDHYTGEDLEAIARKKFESKIKNIQEGGK